MSDEARVESMVEEDVAAVVAVEGEGGLGSDEIKAELSRPWSRRWVVREADKGVVAFAIAWHVVDELHLLNLATRLDRRRLGHGRALTNALVGYARAHNVRQVFLEVRVTNASAIRLYRRVGFVGIGRRNGYYPDGEDALDMVLRLDPQTGAVVPGTDDVTLP